MTTVRRLKAPVGISPSGKIPYGYVVMPESVHDRDPNESDDRLTQATDPVSPDSKELDPWRDHQAPPTEEPDDDSRMLDDLSEGPEPVLTDDESTAETLDGEDPGPLKLFPESVDESVETVQEDEKPEDDVTEEPEIESGEDLNSELERLEMLLRQEFVDTLSGVNFFTAPLGFFILVIAILAWLLNPLLEFLNMGGMLGDNARIVPIMAAILSLAGIHLLFYWSVHRISNLVKSRELDRLIVSRRVDRPCRFLDCYEAEEELLSVEDIINGLDETTGDTLRWRCTLYDTELEVNPICAVCDRFEPREGGSQIIRL